MNLIFTLDYELFGDGTGNIFDHIVFPTDRILNIFEKFGIKITIFFEVIEYWAIKNEWQNGNKMGYQKNPIKAIESQILKAHLSGHDIQLHFHPQWLNAYYDKRWFLNNENWRLSEFKNSNSFSMAGLFQAGQKTLYEIIKKPNWYNGKIIRVGYFNVLPSGNIIDAMKKTGIQVDSSVFPGGYENGSLSQYDFRSVANDIDYWFSTEDDLTIPSESKHGPLEIPIFALQKYRFRKYCKERILSILVNKKSAIENIRSKTKQKNLIEKILYLFKKESLTWDFCLLSPRLHKLFLKHIETQLKGKRENFVLIGHSKNFTSQEGLLYVIQKGIENNFKFITLGKFSEMIIKK